MGDENQAGFLGGYHDLTWPALNAVRRHPIRPLGVVGRSPILNRDATCEIVKCQPFSQEGQIMLMARSKIAP